MPTSIKSQQIKYSLALDNQLPILHGQIMDNSTYKQILDFIDSAIIQYGT